MTVDCLDGVRIGNGDVMRLDAHKLAMLLMQVVDNLVALATTALVHQPEVGPRGSEWGGDIMKVPFLEVRNNVDRDRDQRDGIRGEEVFGDHFERGRAVAQLIVYINNRDKQYIPPIHVTNASRDGRDGRTSAGNLEQNTNNKTPRIESKPYRGTKAFLSLASYKPTRCPDHTADPRAGSRKSRSADSRGVDGRTSAPEKYWGKMG